MRLMIVVLTVTALIIVDQYKFRGYYGSQVSQYISKTLRSVI